MRNGGSDRTTGPCVVVYRDHILPASETFILAQTAAYTRYRPVLAGSRRVPGLDPEVPVLVVNAGGVGGRLREIAFKATGQAPGLIRALRKRRPTLLHAHFGQDAAVALPLRRQLNVPQVVTFHGYDATIDPATPPVDYPDRIYRRRHGRLIRESTLALAVSRFIADRLLAAGWDAERVRIHHIGVDTDFFRPPTRREREPVVLFVARLVEKKGGTHFLDAMARVRASLPGARAVVIGDGPLRSVLQRRSDELGVNAEFLGTQPREVVREWMGRATVFCVPSVVAANGDAEGFGMVFAEAQAMGLPVVAHRSGGIAEAVADGETGLLVPEGDTAALAAAIHLLMSDHARWSSFSEAGMRRIGERFNLRRQTADLEVIYDEVRAHSRDVP